MPHFMQLVDNTSLGALNFTDGDMNPIERVLTIKGVDKRKPPAGGKEKVCMMFEETPKVWFIPVGQMKRLANFLMIADHTRWPGCVATLSCATVKSPKGGETMGIIIVKAEKGSGQLSTARSIKQTDATQTTEPNPEDDGRE